MTTKRQKEKTVRRLNGAYGLMALPDHVALVLGLHFNSHNQGSIVVRNGDEQSSTAPVCHPHWLVSFIYIPPPEPDRIFFLLIGYPAALP